MRNFDTGATRDTDEGKPDYEGFLSPLVIEAYGRYMTKNRVQADGNVRDSDNWQKGIPMPVYIKSAWRHFVDWWKLHRMMRKAPLTPIGNEALEDACCAVMFNVMGYLHEHLGCQVVPDEGFVDAEYARARHEANPDGSDFHINNAADPAFQPMPLADPDTWRKRREPGHVDPTARRKSSEPDVPLRNTGVWYDTNGWWFWEDLVNYENVVKKGPYDTKILAEHDQVKCLRGNIVGGTG